MLAIIFGPPATQRQRTRLEAYHEGIKGHGTLTGFGYPRC